MVSVNSEFDPYTFLSQSVMRVMLAGSQIATDLLVECVVCVYHGDFLLIFRCIVLLNVHFLP